MLDIGLLGALSKLDKTSIINGNKIFVEFKGALTEQYVFQQINKLNLYYWSAKNSKGEVDFLLQNHDKVVPIEVKAEENLKSKSLKALVEKYKLDAAIRISMSDYRKENILLNYPLYCLYDEFLKNDSAIK